MATKSKFQCTLCQHIFDSSEERPHCPMGCHFSYERPTARGDYVSTLPYQPPEVSGALASQKAPPAKRRKKRKISAKPRKVIETAPPETDVPPPADMKAVGIVNHGPTWPASAIEKPSEENISE